MNAAGRLGAYGAALALVFGGAYAVSGALVPDAAVEARSQNAAQDSTKESAHGEGGGHSASSTTADQAGEETHVSGTSISEKGFTLDRVQAPTTVAEQGELSFTILDADGAPVRDYDTAHGKDLHLIIVRSDGTGYRHVHPELDAATGTWSLPWTWEAAGTYRVYTDFTSNGTAATLSRTVEVAGDYSPELATEPVATDSVGGFEVTIHGELVAGGSGDLRVEVTRDGAPVTTLQPYLGAFGHLVALREGDLAYLHVHAHGEEPQPGDLAGPEVTFTAETPTAGRYLLYLDFQVDGEVHTAEFVLDTGVSAEDSGAGKSGAEGADSENPDAEESGAGHDGTEHGH